MDSGVLGLDGLVCLTAATTTNSVFASENAAEAEHKCYGSGFFKQERRAGTTSEDEYREFKLAKTASSEAMLLQERIPLLRSNSSNLSEGQQMLSFSSPNSQTLTLPYCQQTSSSFNRNTGYGSGGINAASMHGLLSGVRGPFTPSQWMELEHQALIYKYIIANVPIPSYLLNPIRKALESTCFSSFSGLRPNALGWGSFHLGFSNTDPEPGRCRRTDGKKWRCSRDAVVDQKYCERHMNRGRHRSRKPVEGQSGHSVTGTNTTTTKLMPITSSISAAAVVPGAGASNNLTLNRSSLEKENVDEGYQRTTGLSMLSSNTSLKDNRYSVPKKQNAYVESSCSKFGLVCSDSLLNPLDRSSSFVNSNLNDHKSKSQHPLRQFMDEWPKNPSECSAVSWPDVDIQSDRTQLSISIPVVTSDFVSSTSSPVNEKLTASRLRLSPELEATQMGLGVGIISSEQRQRQTNWIPISWEHSEGGPLGEVLHSTNNSKNDRKNTMALSRMEGWDRSPCLASSPTGVLQRGAHGSLSNSSAGSSPRAESSKTLDGASLCNGPGGSSLMNPSFPAM
ncbi:growth-regulating factor 1-like isoform X2 [Olea europaea var. sylvestris]|uniref:Growth-regulating factor n=1 Tax=Olea europaea subsp. europaea TaxID=158383 RepID=A0A8S0QZ26_OLEEU|nr:growth-regulating factor 1-like isoform X2 [Olea europaea var. sylvestris]CAA2971262.1 growth-regulating factor 1-like [Olea europaea subsp. europaea]